MFHERLDQAIATAILELKSRFAEFDFDLAGQPFSSGISYPQEGSGETPCIESNFPLTSLKGKPTKKFGHIQIWRHRSGRYEQNNYIL